MLPATRQWWLSRLYLYWVLVSMTEATVYQCYIVVWVFKKRYFPCDVTLTVDLTAFWLFSFHCRFFQASTTAAICWWHRALDFIDSISLSLLQMMVMISQLTTVTYYCLILKNIFKQRIGSRRDSPCHMKLTCWLAVSLVKPIDFNEFSRYRKASCLFPSQVKNAG